MKYALFVVFLFSGEVLTSKQTEFGWLIGTRKEENKMSFETWKNDGEFLLRSSCKIDPSGNRTVTENIKIVKKGSDFYYYVPNVVGRQGEVESRITTLGKGGFTAGFLNAIPLKRTRAGIRPETSWCRPSPQVPHPSAIRSEKIE